MDAVCEALVTRGPSGSMKGWVSNSRVKTGEKLTRDALEALTQVKAWNRAKFLEEAGRGYEQLLTSATSGNLRLLKPITTEFCYRTVKRGVAEGIAEHGARQGAKLLRTLTPPVLVQARKLYVTPELMNEVQQPDFVQITTRHSTLQQPTAAAYQKPKKGEDGYWSSSDSEDEAEPLGAVAASAGGSAAGEWMPVEHSPSGRLFYYNSLTGESTWEKPSSRQSLVKRPFRIEQAGFIREEVSAAELAGAGNAAAGSSGGPRIVRVEQHVVWELSLSKGVPYMWRMAKV